MAASRRRERSRGTLWGGQARIAPAKVASTQKASCSCHTYPPQENRPRNTPPPVAAKQPTVTSALNELAIMAGEGPNYKYAPGVGCCAEYACLPGCRQ
jgi:hypothetical protein